MALNEPKKDLPLLSSFSMEQRQGLVKPLQTGLQVKAPTKSVVKYKDIEPDLFEKTANLASAVDKASITAGIGLGKALGFFDNTSLEEIGSKGFGNIISTEQGLSFTDVLEKEYGKGLGVSAAGFGLDLVSGILGNVAAAWATGGASLVGQVARLGKLGSAVKKGTSVLGAFNSMKNLGTTYDKTETAFQALGAAQSQIVKIQNLNKKLSAGAKLGDTSIIPKIQENNKLIAKFTDEAKTLEQEVLKRQMIMQKTDAPLLAGLKKFGIGKSKESAVTIQKGLSMLNNVQAGGIALSGLSDLISDERNTPLERAGGILKVGLGGLGLAGGLRELVGLDKQIPNLLKNADSPKPITMNGTESLSQRNKLVGDKFTQNLMKEAAQYYNNIATPNIIQKGVMAEGIDKHIADNNANIVRKNIEWYKNTGKNGQRFSDQEWDVMDRELGRAMNNLGTENRQEAIEILKNRLGEDRTNSIIKSHQEISDMYNKMSANNKLSELTIKYGLDKVTLKEMSDGNKRFSNLVDSAIKNDEDAIKTLRKDYFQNNDVDLKSYIYMRKTGKTFAKTDEESQGWIPMIINRRMPDGTIRPATEPEIDRLHQGLLPEELRGMTSTELAEEFKNNPEKLLDIISPTTKIEKRSMTEARRDVRIAKGTRKHTTIDEWNEALAKRMEQLPPEQRLDLVVEDRYSTLFEQMYNTTKYKSGLSKFTDTVQAGAIDMTAEDIAELERATTAGIDIKNTEAGKRILNSSGVVKTYGQKDIQSMKSTANRLLYGLKKELLDNIETATLPVEEAVALRKQIEEEADTLIEQYKVGVGSLTNEFDDKIIVEKANAEFLNSMLKLQEKTYKKVARYAKQNIEQEYKDLSKAELFQERRTNRTQMDNLVNSLEGKAKTKFNSFMRKAKKQGLLKEFIKQDKTLDARANILVPALVRLAKTESSNFEKAKTLITDIVKTPPKQFKRQGEIQNLEQIMEGENLLKENIEKVQSELDSIISKIDQLKNDKSLTKGVANKNLNDDINNLITDKEVSTILKQKGIDLEVMANSVDSLANLRNAVVDAKKKLKIEKKDLRLQFRKNVEEVQNKITQLKSVHNTQVGKKTQFLRALGFEPATSDMQMKGGVTNLAFRDDVMRQFNNVTAPIDNKNLIAEVESVTRVFKNMKTVGDLLQVWQGTRALTSVLMAKEGLPGLWSALKFLGKGLKQGWSSGGKILKGKPYEVKDVIGDKAELERQIKNGATITDIHAMTNMVEPVFKDKIIKNLNRVDLKLRAIGEWADKRDGGKLSNLGKATAGAVKRFTEAIDHVGFKEMTPAWKMQATSTIKDQLMTKGLTEKEAYYNASQMADNIFAGQNWNLLLADDFWGKFLTKDRMRGLRIATFAPDFLMSNARWVSDLTKRGAVGDLARKQYAGFLGMTYLMTELINYGINKHSTWENDYGKEMQLKIPYIKDTEGNSLYINLFGKHREPLALISDPMKFATNKMGILPGMLRQGFYNKLDYPGAIPTPMTLEPILDEIGYQAFGTPKQRGEGKEIKDTFSNFILNFIGLQTSYGNKDTKPEDRSLLLGAREPMATLNKSTLGQVPFFQKSNTQ